MGEATPDFGDEEKSDLQTIDPEAVARGDELLQRFLALPQKEEEYGDGESFWNLFALDLKDEAALPELDDPEAVRRGEEILHRFLAQPQNEDVFFNLFALDFDEAAPTFK